MKKSIVIIIYIVGFLLLISSVVINAIFEFENVKILTLILMITAAILLITSSFYNIILSCKEKK
jgi:hypothetical protein